MNNRIKFIKKQKESFNNNVSYINVKTEEELLDEQLQHIADPILRENFKEGIFKAIRRAVNKAVKGFASLGDALKGVDLNKLVVRPVERGLKSALDRTVRCQYQLAIFVWNPLHYTDHSLDFNLRNNIRFNLTGEIL